MSEQWSGRVTRRSITFRLDAAPKTTGTTSGLFQVTCIPDTARIIWSEGANVRVELVGLRVLKSGKVANSYSKITVSLGEDDLYMKAPPWVLSLVDELA